MYKRQVLGIGRAIGETMAVVMVAGNQDVYKRQTLMNLSQALQEAALHMH